MDQLSYQAAIRRALVDEASDESNFTFEIIDGDEIEAHEYRLTGNELINTPVGVLSTVKLERVREASDERLTEIWLAED